MTTSLLIPPESVQKILVIKLRHFGDVLLTTPVFTHLKEAYPQAEIDALVYEETDAMLQGHPAICRIITCRSSKKEGSFGRALMKDFLLLLSLRKNRYDLIVDLSESQRGAAVCFFSKAPCRVGRAGRSKGIFKRAHTHGVKKGGGDRHVVELHLDALRRIGIHPGWQERRLQFFIPLQAHKRIDDWLKERNASQYILFHPTSRWLFKSLPVTLMASLICWLREKGHTVIISCSPCLKEKALVDALNNACPRDSFLQAANMDLKELGALIAKAKLFIGVDSAPMHMAAALQKPIVAFFGPTSPKAWGPWSAPGNSPHVEIVTQSWSCQPCGLDGCGGGKVSDCLQQLRLPKITSAIERALHFMEKKDALRTLRCL